MDLQEVQFRADELGSTKKLQFWFPSEVRLDQQEMILSGPLGRTA